MARRITSATIPNISNSLGCAVIGANGNNEGQLPIGMAITLNLHEPRLSWTLTVSERYARWADFLIEAHGTKGITYGYD